jgi:RNA polymerase sigma factor (sigma-70 family)
MRAAITGREGCAPSMERSRAPRPEPRDATTSDGTGETPAAAVPVIATPGRAYGPGQDDFERLYRNEFRAVVAVVHSLTGRRDVAEEITQDAFVVTHDQWRRVSGYDRPADFVRRVALNRALSTLRRRKAEHRALERWEGRNRPAETALSGDDEWGLWAAVRTLPDRQAKAVALMYVEDQSVARIAEILGCSENTVKTHLKRARATLSAALEANRTDSTRRWAAGHG